MVTADAILSHCDLGNCPFCNEPIKEVHVTYGVHQSRNELRLKTPYDLKQDTVTIMPCLCTVKRRQSVLWKLLCAWSRDTDLNDCFGQEMFPNLLSH